MGQGVDSMSFAPTPTQQQPINNFGTAVASGTLTATAAGSLIVVLILNQLASGSATSVTDNIGNTYVLGVSSAGTSQRHLEIWYCLSATAGVTAVTVNNAAGTNVAGSVQEWAGGASSARTPASLNNASSASPPAATVTALAGDAVIGGLAYLAAVASTRQETLSDGTYTALTPVTRGTTTMFAGAYKVLSGSATTGPTWTMSPGVSTGEATIAFVPKGAVTVTAVAAAAAIDAPIPVITNGVALSGGGPAVVTAAAAAPVVSAGATVAAIAATASAAAPSPVPSATVVGPVRETSGTNASATGGTCAFPATAAGNGILLILTRVGGLATGALTGVTDNAAGGSNPYSMLTRGAVTSGSNTRIEIWYSPNAKSASSISYASGTAQAGGFKVLELAGLSLTGVIDGSSPDNSATASSTSVTTPSVSASTGDFVFAAAHFTLTTAPLASAGWTAFTDFDDAAGSGRAAWMLAPSAASYSATWSPLGTARQAGVATIAFAPAVIVPPGGVVVTSALATTQAAGNAPTVTGAAQVNSTVASLSAAAPAPVPSGAAKVSSVVATANIQAIAPALAGGLGGTVLATQAAATAQAAAPGLQGYLPAVVTAVAASIVAAAGTPGIQVGATVAAVRGQASLILSPPTIQFGQAVISSAAATTIRVEVPTLLGGGGVTVLALAGTANSAAASPVVTKSLDVLISAAVGNALAATPAPGVTSGSSIVVALAQALAAAQPPLAQGGTLIYAVAARSVAAMREPRAVVLGAVRVDAPAMATARMPGIIRPYGFKVRRWRDILNGPLIPPQEFE